MFSTILFLITFTVTGQITELLTFKLSAAQLISFELTVNFDAL